MRLNVLNSWERGQPASSHALPRLCLLSDSVLTMRASDEQQAALLAATTLRRGVLSLARRLRVERPPASLTMLELSVLGHLHRRGPLSPGDLAAVERVLPQSLTRTLSNLETSALALREPDQADGRRSLLAITKAGLLALRAEMDVRDSWLAAAMDAQLTGTEIGLLQLAGELLERLADADQPARP